MPRKKVELTSRYKAVDDQGAQHVIEVYTEFIEVAGFSEPASWLPGLESHKMAATGNHVNVHQDGTLEDVHTGRRMRRL